MIKKIVKRDGNIVPFNKEKISVAISKAFKETQEVCNQSYDELADAVVATLIKKNMTASSMLEEVEKVEIETVQDTVESVLMDYGYKDTAKAYILYRQIRTIKREKDSKLVQSCLEIHTKDAAESDSKRENANVDGDTAMGTMLKYGSTASKAVADVIMEPKYVMAHNNGDIHIHDKDFWAIGTTTCTQIDLTKLFDKGFNTGHGYLRSPRSIMSYGALSAVAIQANQNEQHGGQSVPNFDRMMAPGVKLTYRKKIKDNLISLISIVCEGGYDEAKEMSEKTLTMIEKEGTVIELANDNAIVEAVATKLAGFGIKKSQVQRSIDKAYRETDRETYQAMEACIHNLNTLHSRAGAQVPFSSLNYGTDTSAEARMVVRNLLLATDAGLGDGETPIFPIQIFRCKSGINFEEGDPNYDLFKLACKVSAKRLFPNFSFQDAPFNLEFYDPDDPRTEVAYMGCRTRVMSNVNGPQISYSRGNLSFTSINLVRIGIEANGNWETFYKILDEKLTLVKDQLLERFDLQCKKKAKNFPFLMHEGLWLGGETLGSEDEVREILKNGTLSIGFIGLAETLVAMMGKHHGESEEAQERGLGIVKYIRAFTDRCTEQYHLNFSCLATPAEGLSGRFVKIDRKKYGKIEGVTDRDYYTNSFHVPVYYNISAFDKIHKEAPYHALTNGGHISYIELDGDPLQNLSAFEKIVKEMGRSGIGYGAINHAIDRDPVCGYTGIIGDTCPRCGRREGEGIEFERIRRITGYLVGTLKRFNNGKAAEERDRVKHGVPGPDNV